MDNDSVINRAAVALAARLAGLPHVAGVTGSMAWLPVDAQHGVVLTINDGQLARADVLSREHELPTFDVSVEGPGELIEQILAGHTPLVDVIHEMRIIGDIWALFSLPPVLHNKYPRDRLRRNLDFSTVAAAAAGALRRCPAAEGFQLWMDLDGTTFGVAMGSTTGGRPMATTTRHHVRCATKPLLALVAQLLEDEGLVSLDTPLASLNRFPNLATSNASLRDLLCHDAGLDLPRQIELYFAGPRRGELLASVASATTYERYSEVAAWHVLEYALVDATGFSIEDLIATRLPESVLQHMHFGTSLDGLEVGTYFASKDDDRPNVPLLMDLAPAVNQFNSPAMGGLTTAEGIGSIYRVALAGPDPIRNAIATMRSYRRGVAADPILERHADFCVGFMVGLADHGFGPYVGDQAFGHTGWLGSSWGFCDPELKLSCGFLHNGFTDAETNDAIRRDVVAVMYDVVGRD